MQNFDIISDLNLNEEDNFSWEGKATSLACIVAGNISCDRDILFSFLKELGNYYAKVFFIDGSLEHQTFGGNFIESYADLSANIDKMENVYFLHESIVIINGITLVSTNGWTTFDFTGKSSIEETIEFLDLKEMMTDSTSYAIRQMSLFDTHYLENSIETCQTITDCKDIVLITSSIPSYDFIKHDHDYEGTILGDVSGNSNIHEVIDLDSENKISSWIFGTYKGDIDSTIDGIRYLNNVRGEKDLSTYYPKILNL